jgi:hypothetical protein
MEQYFESRISEECYGEFTPNCTVISVSLFTCDDAYNKFNEYIDGLHIIIKTFNKYNPKIKFLIFYDNDLIVDLFANYIGVYLCKFDFPEFRMNDHHIGMFGTLMRYLPMFLSKFQYKYLYIIDCDVIKNWVPLSKVNIYKNFIKTDCDMHILTIPSAPLNPRFIGMENNLNTWVRMTGEGIILRRIKFPISILHDFLHIYINSDEYRAQIDITFNKNKEYDRKLKQEHGKFIYGVDEFMLVFLMKYIEENKISFVYTVYPHFYRVAFYYWVENEATEDLLIKLKVALNGQDLMKFVNSYTYKNRQLMFRKLFSLIDINEYFSPVVCECIKREYKYLECVYSVPYEYPQ